MRDGKYNLPGMTEQYFIHHAAHALRERIHVFTLPTSNTYSSTS